MVLFSLNSKKVCLFFISVFFLYGCDSSSNRTPNNGTESSQSDRERYELIKAIAAETYVYGLAPISVMEKKYNQTNPTSDPVYAPINKLYIDTIPSTPESQLWPSPNANVIYSSVHLDLTVEPIIIYTPSIQDRYYSWEIMDAYTNAFQYIGTRSTGQIEGTYAITGPDWEGNIPDGYIQIPSPTNNVWMVGRHEVAPSDVDPNDRYTVIELVKSSILLPLSEFLIKDVNYINPIISKPTNEVPVLDISGIKFYSLLNDWLTLNPPPARDNNILNKMLTIGVGENLKTDFMLWPELDRDALLKGEGVAEEGIKYLTFVESHFYDGWGYTIGDKYGNYGVNYLVRATVARCCTGMNINAEAVYPTRFFGPNDVPLNGQIPYKLLFDSGKTPPINHNGFWSLTIYDLKTGSLIENSIHRYTIGSKSNLYVDPNDGSTTIYIQSTDPGGNATRNWLPSPKNNEPFYMLFRIYNPSDQVITIDGGASKPEWTIPNLILN